ncbi:MAG: lipopolysaccharide assembly protein LapA domain-containing protein [Gammaproteobacteria bacterium]|nr:lipopolysaccharide assembly protein LapA domain-containing protein [Gammaproteobacteria bacterium]MDH4255855.1 lipopolysaccharide assembly protein LapA domain-containing protein [Gammaproteobacteria bacterium]MDH5311789.1 lipopolysaccharide assembly protein LapA domain-containing protein [Gammaproteobacteria bacterium]
MLKRIGLIGLFLLVFVLMIWFTSINPGTISIDLAFGTVEPTIPLALAVSFVLGWLFGLISVAFYVLGLLNERRRLRSALRSAESEVSSLRSLPLADAD